MILLINNYGGFTYNLYQSVGALNSDITVVKNDEMTIGQIEQLAPSHIIISPGAGKPKDAGVCGEAVACFKGKIPILGVCMGMQVICEVFGGEVVRAKKVACGEQSPVHLANGSPIFRGLSPIIHAGRYNSLSVKRESLPDEMLVIAEDNGGEVMGVKHRDYNIFGVQFHPESILTKDGAVIMANFLRIGCDGLD